MKKAAILILAISVLLAATLFGAGQETKPPMKQALLKLNYVHPGDIMMLLQPYESREGRITYSNDQRMVTITDYPENIEKILAAIKEIDVKPADVQFVVQLVLASEDGEAKTDQALTSDPIINELKGFLKYKSFSLLDTSLVRALNNQNSEVSLGSEGEFNLELRPVSVTNNRSESLEVYVRLRQRIGTPRPATPAEKAGMTVPATVASGSQVLIESSLSMKSGDKTVVGVSRTAGGDKGLILIIQAKVLG
jgi:type II secretory pathway component GspD/PulD (secretin)